MERKTKIVCTIGPASESPNTIEQMVLAGMDVARLNFSHGTFEEHRRKIEAIREISNRLDRCVSILQDLSGPKIRIGEVKDGGIELRRHDPFFLTTEDIVGEESGVSVTYPPLTEEVRPGDTILLADGTIELQVTRVEGKRVHCIVTVGGHLTSGKGINFPTRTLTAPAFTDKDHEALRFGLRHGVDLVAISFVKDAADIEAVKGFLRDACADIPVIAKIERRGALERIDEILEVADGIMVARGDLGVETPLEKIPEVQKMLIRKANILGKPAITATQMLRSMVDHTRPTRAEVTDVVNAIHDGTDAVMLSEETATGRFPVDSVAMMARIAKAAEETFPHEQFLKEEFGSRRELPPAISYAATLLAEKVSAVAIVTPTESGSTARWVSRLRPRQPILAPSRNLSTVRGLNLSWGVRPILVRGWKDTDEMLEESKKMVVDLGIASRGDRIVIIAGIPISTRGTTNLIKVEVV